MRQIFPMKVIENEEHKNVFTYYKILKDTGDEVLISTSIPFEVADSEHDILKLISNDLLNDPLLECFYGSGKYRLKNISLKVYEDSTSIYINFNLTTTNNDKGDN